MIFSSSLFIQIGFRVQRHSTSGELRQTDQRVDELRRETFFWSDVRFHWYVIKDTWDWTYYKEIYFSKFIQWSSNTHSNRNHISSKRNYNQIRISQLKCWHLVFPFKCEHEINIAKGVPTSSLALDQKCFITSICLTTHCGVLFIWETSSIQLIYVPIPTTVIFVPSKYPKLALQFPYIFLSECIYVLHTLHICKYCCMKKFIQY